MAVTGPIAGVAFLKVDGNQYSLRGSFKVQPNNLEASGVAGQDGVHGYMEKPVVPYIEGEISDSGGLSVQALAAIRTSTITAELANGKVYVLSNAWYSGTQDLDTTEGKMTVKFEGITCLELMS